MRRRVVNAPRAASRFTPNRRPAVQNPDDEAALSIRETFTDREAERSRMLPWNWPKRLLHIGVCEAVMYESDKWKPRRGDMELYKHVAEGPQQLYVREGFIKPYDGYDVEVVGESSELEDMPKSIAVLADAVGFQCTLFEQDGDGLYLPERGGAVQVDTPGCTLAGGQHSSGKKFLVIYDRKGVCALITGDILDIEADGITG